MWFWKKTPLPPLPKSNVPLPIEKDGRLETISSLEFEKITGAAFIPQLDFADISILSNIKKRTEKLYRKGELTREQLWLGSYYRKEILSYPVPDVFLRYIDPVLGWGVFAARPFKKMEFIAEYTGKLRKRRRSDNKNAYCFEYVSSQGFRTPYTIDALDQGGISRYINHSAQPNLLSSLATVDKLSHIILIAKEPIPKGAQLSYDYGNDYWSCRTAPRPL